MTELNLTNHLLIAMPNLADPNFHQTVAYICAHNHEGAMGIVVNRPSSLGLGEVLSQMELEAQEAAVNNIVVYHGGPVQRDRGFILHSPASDWEMTLKVNDSYGLTTSRDILDAIAHGRGPEQCLIALGYAGWGAGQLEQELADNAWLNGPAQADILFRVPAEQRWQAAFSALGVHLDQLSTQVGHA
jgi:putative transcriptional regulator